MNEVMIRNSTRNEIENDHENYTLESALFAIKRLIEIDAADSSSKDSLYGEIRDLEESMDTLTIYNDSLTEEVESLKEELEKALVD